MQFSRLSYIMKQDVARQFVSQSTIEASAYEQILKYSSFDPDICFLILLRCHVGITNEDRNRYVAKFQLFNTA